MATGFFCGSPLVPMGCDYRSFRASGATNTIIDAIKSVVVYGTTPVGWQVRKAVSTCSTASKACS